MKPTALAKGARVLVTPGEREFFTGKVLRTHDRGKRKGQLEIAPDAGGPTRFALVADCNVLDEVQGAPPET